jgi:hypothetical protein
MCQPENALLVIEDAQVTVTRGRQLLQNDPELEWLTIVQLSDGVATGNSPRLNQAAAQVHPVGV